MDEHSSDRRNFLGKLGGAALVALSAEAAWASVRFARAPVSYGPSQRRNLGHLDRFVSSRVYVGDAGLFVGRDSKGLSAMSATCTHLGCTVREAAEGGFVCPCHGSTYDEHGHVTGGPAPRDLSHVRLLRDVRGNLIADLSQTVPGEARLQVG